MPFSPFSSCGARKGEPEGAARAERGHASSSSLKLRGTTVEVPAIRSEAWASGGVQM